jgi:hypothetical protein
MFQPPSSKQTLEGLQATQLRPQNTTCINPTIYIHTHLYRFTFLPIALFIQCLNVTNLFYTVSVILQFQPSISVNSPLAPLIPLSFVVLLGLVKELLADLKRWKYDRNTNKITFKKISK